MRSAALACVALAGCWDFDSLRGRDAAVPDLSTADGLDAAGADQAGMDADTDLAFVDLAVNVDFSQLADLAGSDAEYCFPPPAAPLFNNIIFAAPGGTGDCSGAQPCSLTVAVSKAPVSIYALAGVYAESLKPSGPVAIYGGFTAPGYKCRDPINAQSQVQGDGTQPAISFDAVASGSLLDGMLILGAAQPAQGASVTAIDLADGFLTVQGSLVQAQYPQDALVAQSIGILVHHGALLEAMGSQFVAGVSTAGESVAIESHSAQVVLKDCTVAELQESMLHGYGIALSAPDPTFKGSALLLRTRVVAINMVGAATGVQLLGGTEQDDTVIEGCAIGAAGMTGASALALEGDGAQNNAEVVGSTLIAGKSGGQAAVALEVASNPSQVALADSILLSDVPIDLHEPTTLVTAGVNLLWGASTTVLFDEASGTKYDIAGYRATYNDPLAVSADPFLDADSMHLTAQSTAAIDHAAGCVSGADFDGTPRPTGLACDIGADEFP